MLIENTRTNFEDSKIYLKSKFTQVLFKLTEFCVKFQEKKILKPVVVALSAVLLSALIYSLPIIENIKADSPDIPYPVCLDSSISITDVNSLARKGIFITDDTCLVSNKVFTNTSLITLNPQPFSGEPYKYVFYNTDGLQDYPTFDKLGYVTDQFTVTNGGWYIAPLFTHVEIEKSNVISFPVVGSPEHGKIISFQAPLGKLYLVGEITHAKVLSDTLINFVLMSNGERSDEFIKLKAGISLRFAIRNSPLLYGVNIFGNSAIVGLIETSSLTSKLPPGELVGNKPEEETVIHIPIVAR